MNSLCFDRDGNPRITYRAQGWLKYAWKHNGVWYSEKIDSIMPKGGAQASYTGLEIDKNGYAHISYNDEEVWMYSTTKYATGYPEVGINIGLEKHDKTALSVCPDLVYNGAKIKYTLDERRSINVSIYNVLGQKVLNLVNEKIDAGRYTYYWNLKDDQKRDVRSGIYFCYLRIQERLLTSKFIITR